MGFCLCVWFDFRYFGREELYGGGCVVGAVDLWWVWGRKFCCGDDDGGEIYGLKFEYLRKRI